MERYNLTNTKHHTSYLQNICFCLIWVTVIYSSIIQYKYFEIQNGMLILGVLILIMYLLYINGQPFSLDSLFSREITWMIVYMGYSFISGIVSSPKVNNHISQWVTSIEYLFIMCIIASLLKKSGSDTFHYLLVIVAIILSVLIIYEPVLYTTGRYSISSKLNPNGLGMYFTAGIWSSLYLQYKRKIPLICTFGIIALMEYALINTGSRKALIGSVIVILGWFFICFFPGLKRFSLGKRIAYTLLIVVLASLLVLFFLFYYHQSIISDRMKSIQTEATEGERYQLYQLGWSLFLQQPLIGYGFNGFLYFRGEHSHATFVEVPVSGGILGVALYVVPYIYSINRSIKLLKNSKKSTELMTERGEVKMLLVLWAVMIFYCSCVIHPYQFLSYILFGLIFGKTEYLEKSIMSNKKNKREKSIQRWKYII